jgi:predicted nuclease of predicted toxin-antitoxin system
MRLLADECVDGRLVAGLRGAGHDVVAVRQASRGAGDRLVIEMARREGRVLITEDKDFGDLVFRHGLGVPGLVLLRYVQSDVRAVLERLLAVVDRHRDELHDLHVVVTAKRARLRRLPTPPAPSS